MWKEPTVEDPQIRIGWMNTCVGRFDRMVNGYVAYFILRGPLDALPAGATLLP
jgi:hypothetical protein